MPVTLGHAAPGQKKCLHQRMTEITLDSGISQLHAALTFLHFILVNGKLTQKIVKFIITQNTHSNYIQRRKTKLSAFFIQLRKNRYCKLQLTQLTMLFFFLYFLSQLQTTILVRKPCLSFLIIVLNFFLFNHNLDFFFPLTHGNINNLLADLVNHKPH